MTTGERIRERRKELGLTVDRVAEIVDVNRTTIVRYENGSIERKTIDTLVPIARALNTTVAYLMGWNDEKHPVSDVRNGVEHEAMNCFDSLSDSKKLEALDYLRYLSENAKKK